MESVPKSEFISCFFNNACIHYICVLVSSKKLLEIKF